VDYHLKYSKGFIEMYLFFSDLKAQSAVSQDSSEIILIWWFGAARNISYYYQCWKQSCCLLFLWKK